MRTTSRVVAIALGVLLAGMLLRPTAEAAPPPTRQSAANTQDKNAQDKVLQRYLADTWRSMDAMTPKSSGLPADNVDGSLAASSRSGYTSPTNIGAYLWSTVVARENGLITKQDAHSRMQRTLRTVAGMQKHEPSGMFYNWYDEVTGKRLDIFPTSGDTIQQFLSSVDNAWLATGLLIAGRADKRLTAAAERIRGEMNFSCFYNPAEGEGGQLRGGFWDEQPTDTAAVTGDLCGMGRDVWYTGHHYGAFNTEPRMASYLGIADKQIPGKHYFGTFRTFPPTCDWSGFETKPSGVWRTYSGVKVFEGALPYRGMKVVPTWGGSMFEALMVPLFVPEETWGKNSWGRNHPLYVKGQIEHGLREAGYGYWGFSPSNNPAGGYREYGVDQLGLDEKGYTSDQERTTVDQAFGDCRPAGPTPTAYGDGVVTPHASFLALRYAPQAALSNLATLREDFDAYGRGGFYDAIGTRSGQVSKRYLALDQGMIVAALGNRLEGDVLRDLVSAGGMEKRVKPLMGQEVFSVSDRGAVR